MLTAARPRGSDGFTLIELLAAILIIATLAAIAVPSFASQAGKADGAKVRSELHAAAVALEVCRVETGLFSDCRPALDERFADGGRYTVTLAGTSYTVEGRTDDGAVFTLAYDASGTTRTCSGAPGGGAGCADGSW